MVVVDIKNVVFISSSDRENAISRNEWKISPPEMTVQASISKTMEAQSRSVV